MVVRAKVNPSVLIVLIQESKAKEERREGKSPREGSPRASFGKWSRAVQDRNIRKPDSEHHGSYRVRVYPFVQVVIST
jgi:hypothetical protein